MMPTNCKFTGKARDIIPSIIMFLCAALFFVWPLSHTAGVKNTTLGILLLFSLVVIYKNKKVIGNAKLVVAVGGTLFLWSVLQSLFFAFDTQHALSNFNSLILRPLLSACIGAILAYYFKPSKKFSVIVFIVPLVVINFSGLYELVMTYFESGVVLTRYSGMLDNVDRLNYLTNMLLCLLLAEVAVRLKGGCYLKINNGFLALFFVLLIILEVTEKMRNGILVLSVLLILLLLVFARELSTIKTLVLTGVMVIILSLLVDWSLKDPRWNTFFETVPLAWDTETNQAWLTNGARPLLDNGQMVSHSNYMRIAFVKESLKMIKEYPMGVGLSKSAMGDAFKVYYGKGTGHSHSGILDFTLSLGIVGIVLFISFIISLYRILIRGGHNYFRYAALFLLTDFFVRSFLDSILRDHMFEQAMFIICFMTVSALVYKEKSNDDEIYH